MMNKYGAKGISLDGSTVDLNGCCYCKVCDLEGGA